MSGSPDAADDGVGAVSTTITFPRCPFTCPGRDVSQCEIVELEHVSTDGLGTVGRGVGSWRSCRHLASQPSARGFIPVCIHPSGPPATHPPGHPDTRRSVTPVMTVG
jgi:hypothetical protein